MSTDKPVSVDLETDLKDEKIPTGWDCLVNRIAGGGFRRGELVVFGGNNPRFAPRPRLKPSLYYLLLKSTPLFNNAAHVELTATARAISGYGPKERNETMAQSGQLVVIPLTSEDESPGEST